MMQPNSKMKCSLPLFRLAGARLSRFQRFWKEVKIKTSGRGGLEKEGGGWGWGSFIAACVIERDESTW